MENKHLHSVTSCIPQLQYSQSKHTAYRHSIHPRTLTLQPNSHTQARYAVLMVSSLVIYAITGTWITTHLPTPKGW